MSTKPWIFYDAEIVRCIPDKNQQNKPDLEYCSGWNDFEGMGVSVIGWACSDLSQGVCVVDGLESAALRCLEEMASSCLVVSFNGRNFDDKLMAANNILLRTDYDLLEEVRLSAYGSTSWRGCPGGFTYKLDALARANGIPPKTNSGELAPELWQKGLKRKVVNYCLHDAKITAEVLRLGLTGELKDPNTGSLLKLRPLD